MTIVDRLKHLSEIGTVIPCPKMTLLAGDHEPPVVEGEGEIVVRSSTSFSYTLRGRPENSVHAMRSLRRIMDAPYDGRLRERLTVTLGDGLVVSGGWTIPKVHVPDDGDEWTFTGEVDNLSMHEDGSFVPVTEVAYLLPKDHRARIALRRFFPMPEPGDLPVHHLRVLGTEILFTLDDANDLLLIRAPMTPELRATYTENWLGEPLRILFGQLIYPRFVARISDAWAMSWIRPSPEWTPKSNACALWQGDKELVDKNGFWETYARLLTYIASARDSAGNPNFEANKVTELYVEAIQAARGSRWVWALTYASAAEGMLRLIVPKGTKDKSGNPDAVEKLRAHIDTWAGDARLKEIAKNAASRTLEISAVQVLRQLRDEKWITPDQFKAWDKMRNQVMHGSLVSPYSSAEDDKLLLDLAHLLHALTRRLMADVALGGDAGGGLSATGAGPLDAHVGGSAEAPADA